MTNNRQILSSVANASRLLKQFSSRERELGVSELARRLDLGKSTVHRLMVTLASEHLLEQDPGSGKYRLGLAMYDLGAAVTTHLDLHEAVLPPMEKLRNLTGETVQVAVLDGREVVYVERLDSPHTLRLFLEVGRRNAAHSTSTGKCLLAFRSDQDLDKLFRGWKLEAKTPRTITDHDRLRKELSRVRRQGYSLNEEESELGVMSVAAPIRDASATVNAAISAAGPVTRMRPSLAEIVLAVEEAATTASRRLGFRR